LSSDRRTAREFFRGVIALAAMATGGNLPYRRLCREYGADLTCSEMIVADKLVRGSRAERPLLRRHASEETFGIQLCGRSPAVVAAAARLAAAQGARFIDLNFGCPIDLVVRRGAGSALLKRPRKLAEIVAAVREAVDLPLSVKIRLGWSEQTINAVTVARCVAEAGADAIAVHGRTREQRYRRSADWAAIAEVAEAVTIPVLGNGDILTPWDLPRCLEGTAISSVLVARGALIKPWIFRELKEGRPLDPDVPARWAIMRRYYEYASEYFGEDEKGQGRVRRFLLWHLGFWHRHRAWTEAEFTAARPAALIQQRAASPEADGDAALLASADPADHHRIWQRLLDRDYPAV
jgi:tRNA-dihydrouridine synthase 3